MGNIITFSVIMPCYNSENYITTALESIKNQTYPNWELIAVNDGSTDNTLHILNKYAKEDNRIKIYCKQNGGYVSAVNVGLDKIKGDYFLFLGSDDYLSKDLFKNLYDSVCSLSVSPDCIAFRTQKVKNNVLIGIDYKTNFHSLCFEQNTSLNDYTVKHPEHAAIFSCRDTSKCYKTELLKQLRYFGKYGIDADGIFSMLFCHRACSFLSVPVDGYFWTIRQDSVSATTSPQKNIDRILNWKMFFDILIHLNNDEITQFEREYAAVPRNVLAEMCMDLKNSIKYRKFIVKQAIEYKKFALNFAPQFITTPIKIISFSPVLFSILYKVKKLIKKSF